ncbi:MAG: S-layer homology domain-containing protein [Oscillospiraceae bacterium]|nr:S-layer homology domain-containing protein [Oscillospiraceae bacterium]
MTPAPRLASLCLAITLIAGSLPLPDLPSGTGPPPPGIESLTPRPPGGPSSPGDGMEDVRPTDWFYRYVRLGIRHGYLRGADGGRFEPFRQITRGEFITMLGRTHAALGGEIHYEWDYGPTLIYTDINPYGFYIPYLLWATDIGIVQGDMENRFRPNVPITREELALITVRYIDTYALYNYLWDRFQERGLYSDEALIAPWAWREAHLLRNFGFMEGSPGINPQPGVYHFRPRDPTLRLEAAAILGRLFEAQYEATPTI